MTDCLICGANARKIESGLDGEELNCPDCGHYGVSGTFLATKRDRRFDIKDGLK